jgi:hypothetical protein
MFPPQLSIASVAVSPPGAAGAAVSSLPGNVTVTALLEPPAFPDVSRARTLKVTVDPGANPRTVVLVPLALDPSES